MYINNYSELIDFDLHGINGLWEGIATYDALKGLNMNLPFILSRSKIFGSGSYVSTWSGDNYAVYEFLKYSISGIFASNLFGIPFHGADICGH